MDGPDGSGQSVLRGDGDPAAAGRTQRGVGGDHRDGGVQRAHLAVPGRVAGELHGRRRTQPELAGHFRHPGQPGGGIEYLTGGIHHDDRAHPGTAFQQRRGCAHSPFENPGPGADARAGTAHSEGGPGGSGRGVPELRGGPRAPGAHRQVEDHRGGHDRHRAAGHRHTAALFLEPRHHAVGGRQPVGAAPGEDDGVDVADAVGRVEQVGLPASGRAPTDVDCADRTGRSQDNCCAAGPSMARLVDGADGGVGIAALVMTDTDSGDVGD